MRSIRSYPSKTLAKRFSRGDDVDKADNGNSFTASNTASKYVTQHLVTHELTMRMLANKC